MRRKDPSHLDRPRTKDQCREVCHQPEEVWDPELGLDPNHQHWQNRDANCHRSYALQVQLLLSSARHRRIQVWGSPRYQWLCVWVGHSWHPFESFPVHLDPNLSLDWAFFDAERLVNNLKTPEGATHIGILYSHLWGTPRCVQSLQGWLRLHFCFLLWHSTHDNKPRFRLLELRWPNAPSSDWLLILGLRRHSLFGSYTK